MSGFKIATKVWPRVAHAHGKLMKPTFHESLKALQTEKVDIFYLHAPDYSTPFEETIRLVDELYREGRFERVCFSRLFIVDSVLWEKTPPHF